MKMIEVTDIYSDNRVLINPENILKVEEDRDEDCCNIYLDLSEDAIECKESYEEVLSKIKEAERND